MKNHLNHLNNSYFSVTLFLDSLTLVLQQPPGCQRQQQDQGDNLEQRR